MEADMIEMPGCLCIVWNGQELATGKLQRSCNHSKETMRYWISFTHLCLARISRDAETTFKVFFPFYSCKIIQKHSASEENRWIKIQSWGEELFAEPGCLGATTRQWILWVRSLFHSWRSEYFLDTQAHYFRAIDFPFYPLKARLSQTRFQF